MQQHRTNFGAYSALLKVKQAGKPTSIFDLLSKNKEEEKKEKKIKVYKVFFSSVLIMLLSVIIYN
tara:strand:+ start:133 stop:327 length:195 start_codon:yes stop_codon:yes gene_type:complete